MVAAVAAAPAFAASGDPCRVFATGTVGSNTASPQYLGPCYMTATTAAPAVSRQVRFDDISTWPNGASEGIAEEDYHMTFGYRARNALSGGGGGGDIGNASKLGVVLNVRGDSGATQNSRVVRVTFEEEVTGLSFYVRDLSFHKPSGVVGAPVREAISFSVPTTITNSVGPNTGTDGNLSQTGSVPANTELYRPNGPGSIPTGNKYYYDIRVAIPGPIKTFTLTFGRKTGETTEQYAAAQLTDFTFCTTG